MDSSIIQKTYKHGSSWQFWWKHVLIQDSFQKSYWRVKRLWINMGCIHSQPVKEENSNYIETLTLKRQISKKGSVKDVSQKNLKISISVIADPLSSDEDGPTFTYNMKGVRHRAHACRSSKTFSHIEGRRFMKFPRMVGYKMCQACQEAKDDVLNTVAPEGEKEICRKCSVKKRKGSEKRKELKNLNKSPNLSNNEAKTSPLTSNKIDITAFAGFLALVSNVLFSFWFHVIRKSGSPSTPMWELFGVTYTEANLWYCIVCFKPFYFCGLKSIKCLFMDFFRFFSHYMYLYMKIKIVHYNN